ncbi:MAG: agmatine deiminase family protein [Alphaproteobacteria bacterium]|nr:agmatine deiminase family protein [Alphaproteobacteria bacterium]
MFVASAGAMTMAGAIGTARGEAAFRLAPEWHLHARCFMAFSAAHGTYTPGQIDAIRREQAAVARVISQFEPVTMIANRADLAEVRALCGPTVEILELRHHDIWARDTLPSLVSGADGGTHAVNWNFNVWGERFPGYGDDRDLAERFARHLSIPQVRARVVAEGGAIEVDGEGTLITTETCLLNRNRNPGLSRAEVEAELCRLTGAAKVIWLFGSRADRVTDGHVDGLARFVAPGRLVVEISEDPDDPEYEDLLENARRLDAARDAAGRVLEVVRLRRPRWDQMVDRGNDFAASYVNCYVANGGVVLPRFGDRERDDAARDLFARLMPKYRIVQVKVDEICEGGGGIHCNTQHVPAR